MQSTYCHSSYEDAYTSTRIIEAKRKITIVRGILWLSLSRLFAMVIDSIDADGFLELSKDAIEKEKKWIYNKKKSRAL